MSKHYSGEAGERFGPTLAAGHLAEDHGVMVDAETVDVGRGVVDTGT